MKQFTSEEIQGQFEKLPTELQKVVTSPEIHDKIETIGKRHNLLIDQLGELVDEIGLILLGLEKSSDFVNHASWKLNISSKVATLIAQDVNSEVFNSIKDSLKKLEAEMPPQDTETQARQDISSIERAGGFSIEPVKSEPTSGNGVTSADKNKILAGIENPELNKGNFSKSLISGTENHTEPLVDYLLKNPVGQGEKKVVSEVATENPNQIQNKETPKNTPTKPTIDPYREALK
ncbi:MAG: hypothetical protein AAB470_02210 [Patescibacteria group bacterium]